MNAEDADCIVSLQVKLEAAEAEVDRLEARVAAVEAALVDTCTCGHGGSCGCDFDALTRARAAATGAVETCQKVVHGGVGDYLCGLVLPCHWHPAEAQPPTGEDP